MAKINLKLFSFTKERPDYRAGEILKKVKQNKEMERANQIEGLVTQGYLEVTQESGGYGWAISDYIEFGYIYIQRPIFTSGLDGTAQIDFSSVGGNTYSQELPSAVAALTAETYQPAIFVPRVIHWHIEKGSYLGCYLLVSQLNPETTEVNKTVRVHFSFTGRGFRK